MLEIKWKQKTCQKIKQTLKKHTKLNKNARKISLGDQSEKTG
jgi:hypothetical protein